METAVNNRVRKESTVGSIEVSRVYAGQFQKEGTLTAELKQKFTTMSYYPSKQVADNIQDNPFGTAEFGFQEQEFKAEETRVAWIDVPMNSTIESVKARLAALPNAKIYRILSNRPIISDSQQYAIDNPQLETSLDSIAETQVVRYPDSDPNAGKLILDNNGKIQYKRNALTIKGMEDVDSRTADPADFYASPQLTAELNGVPHVMESQSI